MTRTTLEFLDEQIKELQAQRKALAKVEGIPTIRELFAPFFEYLIVQSAEWTQYTPFFNDGDPCTFSVRNYLSFNGPEDDEDAAEEGRIVFGSYQLPDTDEFVRSVYQERNMGTNSSYYNSPEYKAKQRREHEEYQDRRAIEFAAFKESGLIGDGAKEFKDAIKTVEKWLGSHEDFLLDAFGDHVKVVVTRDGVEVEEYEHS